MITLSLLFTAFVAIFGFVIILPLALLLLAGFSIKFLTKLADFMIEIFNSFFG